MPNGGRLAIDLSDHRVIEADGEYEPLAAGTYLQIAVTDTGVGMDEHVLKHAFDPFFSTKEGRRRSGLGLASVYGIVTNAGGRVTLSSALGVGTRVSLMLPTAADSVNNPDVTLDLMPTLRVSTNYTILVIEDDISVRTLLVHSLERAGYTVVIARDGLDALSLANTLEPDLLVTDVVMPGMSGMQIAARLRERFPRLRTLYTSGYAEKNLGEWQNKANTRFLAKPFRSTDLIRAVQRILNGYNGKAEAAAVVEVSE